jgi:hypothetical protein
MDGNGLLKLQKKPLLLLKMVLLLLLNMAGNGTAVAADKKELLPLKMKLLLLPKMAGKRLCCSLQKKAFMMPNKKIKHIISIISLLQILKKVTTLGSAMPEWCLFVLPPPCQRGVAPHPA